MALSLTTNAQIDNFISGVIGQAAHHAPVVANVILPLSQAVRARLRLGFDDVSVYERNGQIARTCWVTIGGRRWVFSYNYGQQKIDLRQFTTRGPTVFQFDNSTSLTAIQTQAANM